MKQLINPSLIRRLIFIGWMAFVVKAAMLTLLFFLPKQGLERLHVAENSLYGSYKPASAFGLQGKKAEAPKEAPVYRLDSLTLQGLYDDPHNPFIAVAEGATVTMIGRGEVFKGYKLIEVRSDRAVFEKDGKRYELTFKESGIKTDTMISAAEPEVIQDDSAVFVKRNEIAHYAKNFEDIWKNIKIQELIKDKKLEGFEVTWVKKESVFAKLGLREKDIIVAVNGQRLKSISQVFKIYNNMDKLDSLKLTIMRDNQEKELEYEIF
ncbi:MAG: type II secretion system protein GspC [Campylobacterales bacterium]|nr:type II secretion system protein GspC [Campylobacterales bacterium]